MVNFFSSRLTELVLLITLANYVIGDSAGTEGLDVNPAWVFYALYSLHNRLPRALSLTIVIGAATIITDIIFFAVNAPNLRGAAITFGVFGFLFKIVAVVQLYFFLRNDVGAALSLAEEAASPPGGETYAASGGVDEAALSPNAYASSSTTGGGAALYAAQGGYQSSL